MKRLLLLVFVLTVVSCGRQESKPEVFATEEGAIRGYDPVAYFTHARAVKGIKALTMTYKGVDWYFSSAESLEAFRAAPEKYEPQFGGYCAYAVSQNYTYETDPDAFTIVGDKLYLNYDSNTSVHWNSKRDEYIEMAMKNWPKVLNH